ncbi:hypothetical protein F5Y16DRAFT_405549 [Xylariaceae sp. FL0255]|nr:hypothetical protein F5Y16DRAFT_405549 [Xylariaceae sp. FL0255]
MASSQGQGQGQTAANTKPDILIFADGEFTRFFGVLDSSLSIMKEQANVHQADFDVEGASMNLLQQYPSAKAIWVTSASIVKPEFRSLCDRVVQYVKQGGTAIFGAEFSGWMGADDFAQWMTNVWQLPWTFDPYCRGQTALQNSHVGPGDNVAWRSGLRSDDSLKANFLTNVAPRDSLYAVTDEFKASSGWFGDKTKSYTTIAYAKYGNGWLGYTGDGNLGEVTEDATLAMMGLQFDPSRSRFRGSVTLSFGPDGKCETKVDHNPPGPEFYLGL